MNKKESDALLLHPFFSTVARLEFICSCIRHVCLLYNWLLSK